MSGWDNVYEGAHMSERQKVMSDAVRGEDKLREAIAFLDDPEIDVWRVIVALAEAEGHLAAARERLARVSRDALQQALGELYDR